MKPLLRFFGLCSVLFFTTVHAEWVIDGVVISDADDLQMNPAIAHDGALGALIVWQDRRDGSTFDIYVQRVDPLGNALWTPDGVLVCNEAADQTDPRVVSDGAGGAIVVWEDARTTSEFDIYIQHIDASGNPTWATNGVPVSIIALSNQHNPAIVSDGMSGAIVVWQDHRNGRPDIYAQRFDGSGAALWDSVVVCGAPNAQQVPVAIEDASHGVIATWVDRRAGLGDIYVQRVASDGVVAWTTNGVPVCTDGEDQATPVLVNGMGLFVAWADYRNGHYDIFAQTLDESGNALLAVNGVPLCTALGDQTNPTIVSISGESRALAGVTSDAMVAWEDRRAGNADIYASPIGTGDQAWGTDGIPLCTAPLDQTKPNGAGDGSGGAIVVWQDRRPNFHNDIYAQRVEAQGNTLWEANGRPLCRAENEQFDPVAAPSAVGTAIVAWEDLRTGGVYDIYAQQAGEAPTAVAISQFDLRWDGDAVVLRAAFRSDLGVEVVNVYRGEGSSSLRKIDEVAGARSPFEYADNDVIAGRSYRYQIGVVDADGEFFSAPITIATSALPTALEQNRPNPFNPSTLIRFTTSERARATLAVFDAAGHRVRTLVDQVTPAGRHEVAWDGRDDKGVPQSSGVYFYRLQVGKKSEAKKMVLMK
jgi:hypothetical protein